MSKTTDIGLELFRQAFLGGDVSTEQVAPEDYKAAQRILRDMVARGLLQIESGGKYRRYRLAESLRKMRTKSNLGTERMMFLAHAVYYADATALERFRIDREGMLALLFDDALPTHFYSLSDYGEQTRTAALAKSHASLVDAIQNSHALRLTYRKADGTSGRYTLRPYAILVDRYWDYLLAVDANEFRKSPVKTFRLDRIIQSHPLRGEVFEKNAELLRDIQNAKSIYHFTQGDYRTVTLEISEELAESFRTVPYFPFQEFVGYEGDRIRITTRIKRPEEIIPDIKMLMPHVRVIDDLQIIEMLYRDIERYLNN